MALSLVSYDDSEDNDSDNDAADSQEIAGPRANSVTVKHTVSKVSKPNEVKTNRKSDDSEDEYEETSSNHISENPSNFNLPESKITLINTDIDIKCLTSKKNGPVKITIPSLNEVEEEPEQPLKKKLKPSQKGSGLFALLPSPKSSLVPQSVVNKNRNPPKPSPIARAKSIQPVVPKPSKSQSAKKSALITYDDSGDEDESSGTVDFFSLDSKDEELPVSTDTTAIPEVKQVVEQNTPVKNTSDTSLDFKSDFQPPSWAAASASLPSSSAYQPQAANAYHTSDFVSVSSNNLQLDEEAMQQLCGRRDRLKREELNIIDVSGDAIMPDSREWLTKQLSEEQAHRPSHKKKDGPTSQQKRKHQITYLAFQAKENELELKNQWANNRMTRKQTQSKYGF